MTDSTEAVIAVLLNSFKFDLVDGTEVDWLMSITIEPQVRGAKEIGLPLIVSRVEENQTPA